MRENTSCVNRKETRFLHHCTQFGRILIQIAMFFFLNFVIASPSFSGPGPEMPYRIYVDIGYVFSCVTTLAPVCPLIGPFALLYFIILAPMIRWMAVFAYRPKFDSGGDKWPKLYHIIITSLLIGQVSYMCSVSNPWEIECLHKTYFIVLPARVKRNSDNNLSLPRFILSICSIRCLRCLPFSSKGILLRASSLVAA